VVALRNGKDEEGESGLSDPEHFLRRDDASHRMVALATKRHKSDKMIFQLFGRFSVAQY
jgi:hypothetical protein